MDDEDNNQTQALCRRLLPSWRGTSARWGVSLRVPGAAYPRPTRRWPCSSMATSTICRLKSRLSQTEQPLQAVPRRLFNPKAEVAALSAGEAGFAGEVGVDAACDEYAGEAESSGEEGVNAGYGDSAREGSG